MFALKIFGGTRPGLWCALTSRGQCVGAEIYSPEKVDLGYT